MANTNKSVLIVLPDTDFDVTETSVPWRLLTDAGIDVQFTTESGQPGKCDPLLLTGVVFGKLGASPEAIKCHEQMIQDSAYKKPLTYDEVDYFKFDAVLFPGGHAPGMRPYLENKTIREKLVPYINDKSKIVTAVCHGTIVLARTIDPATGKSLLWNRKSTCLPKYMEKTAFYLTAWKLGRYYRTYEEYVEDEVRACMSDPKQQFFEGTKNTFGSLDKKYAYVCIDGNYISARWPGDVAKMAQTLIDKLNST